MRKSSRGVRFAEVEHSTPDCRVQVVLDFDGGTKCDIHTKVAFIDRLLSTFATHALIDIGVKVESDADVGPEAVMEAVGSALGQAVAEALSQDVSKHSFDSATCAVGNVLVAVNLDMGERISHNFELNLGHDSISGVPATSIHEFLLQFSTAASLNLHVRKLAGDNDYHCSLAIFKCLGRCLRDALEAGLARNP